ncbi:hypothetical protein OHS33_39230 (plasmid) [Streptomyces sp. NBC_00536]|uniref:hypothetical protein n=1 Tax=Streptomyces sp. NBC_00536 TaxID=2975769 RepID=UPI002E81C58E|nr:hypothetical protein [Streptomyces sp. NBC_00536]WUC84393.1 hypothetical protein OHS33_39230 [Streptomyces sp. NBC_00536]
MSTPSILAQLDTAPRRRAQRTQLIDAAETAERQHAEARKALHSLNQELDRVRTRAQRADRYIALYPYSPERQQERADIGQELAALEPAQRHAAALTAATNVVRESARLELAWFDRPRSSAPGVSRAEVIQYHDAAVPASSYSVTRLWAGIRKPGEPWQSYDPDIVRRSRARSILAAWSSNPDNHLLRDAEGRLYIAGAGSRLEFVPNDIAPPATEGEALRAALAVYGYPTYDFEDCGMTSVIVPGDPRASEYHSCDGLYFQISSGEYACRPASAHDEPWGASVFNHGEYVDTLDASPDGSTLAEDCAHIARAIANYSLPVPAAR